MPCAHHDSAFCGLIPLPAPRSANAQRVSLPLWACSAECDRAKCAPLLRATQGAHPRAPRHSVPDGSLRRCYPLLQLLILHRREITGRYGAVA
jgi:hypothetical protein